jgi:hypothetical protein
MITPSVPGAPDEAWTTPARPGTPPVSPSPATREVAETPDPVYSPGDPGAKADTVSASVAGAVAAAQARYESHQQDTYAQGSALGVPVDLPPVPCSESKHTGPPPADGGGYAA